MTTINLRQNQEDEGRKISLQGSNTGFFFSLGILVITFVLFLGLKPYISFLEKKNLALADEIAAKNKEVAGLKQLEKLIDIQRRVAEIKTSLQINNGMVGKTETNKILDNLSSELYTGVTLSSYLYDENKGLEVQFGSGNFSDAAKQVYNLKKSAYFTDVDIKNISRKEKDIITTVTMKIKKG